MLLNSRSKLLFALLSSFVLLAKVEIYGSKNNTKYSKPFVVVLDAGHGGHDSGNRGNGYYEKNIALKIALGIGKILQKNPDIKVIYTRNHIVCVKHLFLLSLLLLLLLFLLLLLLLLCLFRCLSMLLIDLRLN